MSQMLVLPVPQHILLSTLITPTHPPQAWNLAEVCPGVLDT